ncbi:MAG: Flp family type IVb pilin [Acidobacteriota bacterium]
MLNILKRLVVEEEGQGMAEYGLILALIAIVVIATITIMGDKLNNVFESVNNALPS